MRPLSRLLLRVARISPHFISWVLAQVPARVQSGKMPDRKKMLRFLSPQDVDLIFDQQLHDVFKDSFLNAFKQGAWGPAIELQVFQQNWQIQNWDFPFPVHLWHAMDDRLVPPEHSQLLARRIPRAEVHLIETESHYSLPIHRIAEILGLLET